MVRIPIDAQRRPESEPRRHGSPRCRSRSCRAPLNEGRSLNPGDTVFHQIPADAGEIAQRRPESEPRRHALPHPTAGPTTRSLNEGRSLNPGDTRNGARPPAPGATLNEGRSLNPGDTWLMIRFGTTSPPAQRRPESEPRRHDTRTVPGRSPGEPLNEGRSLNPGDTGRRPPGRCGRGSALNEGRSLNPGDTACSGRTGRRRGRPLNEGRSLNPGDTSSVAHASVDVRVRSTKAGV